MKVDQAAGNHMFKVTATDAVRSSETILRFTLPIVTDIESTSSPTSENQTSDEDSLASLRRRMRRPGRS